MYQIIRWVYYDMFGMIRDCMKDISFLDFSLYDFFMSVLVLFLMFRLATGLLSNISSLSYFREDSNDRRSK